MPVIGTLTVNLEANTATFSGDLGKAAKSAEDFGAKAGAAGKRIDYSMREAKGGMMLMSEELGVHIPRHLQTLIAGIPAVGAAFAEMLPLIGVIAAIAIIAKLIAKNEEAKEKLAQGWDKFGVETLTVFGNLDDKMLQVGKTADELAGRHLEALRKELELIDHASLRELAAEFGKLEKAGHTLMVEMKSSWYEIRMGSQGAENALTRFTGEYDLLIAKGDKKGAFDKLVGTLGAANKELKAMLALEGGMYAPSQKHVDAQRLLVSILEDQLRVTKEVDEINTGEKGNVQTADNQKRASEAFKESSRIMHEAMQAMKEDAIAAAKADEEWMKVTIQMAKEGVKQIDVILGSKQKEADEWVKLTEKMIQEDKRHADMMAELEAKDGGSSKGGENKRYQALQAASAKERALLTSTGEQRIADEQKIDHKEEEEEQKHQNKMDELTRKGEQTRANLAKQFAHIALFEQQNMAAALEQLGKQELAALIDNMLQALIVKEDTAAREKLIDAKSSAISAYKWAMQGLPFPVNAIVAPIAAGVAFAGVMAFEQGGMVPGSGPVPATVHGGETVVTKALTDRVEASEGKGGGRRSVTIVQNITAKDADGFKASQSQLHSQAFHAATTASKRNR
jgi:hypothetical protein